MIFIGWDTPLTLLRLEVIQRDYVGAQPADQSPLQCRQTPGLFRVAGISVDREPSGWAFVTEVMAWLLRALGKEVVVRRRNGSDETVHVPLLDDLLGGGRRAIGRQFFPVGHDVENPCGRQWRLRARS